MMIKESLLVTLLLLFTPGGPRGLEAVGAWRSWRFWEPGGPGGPGGLDVWRPRGPAYIYFLKIHTVQTDHSTTFFLRQNV